MLKYLGEYRIKEIAKFKEWAKEEDGKRGFLDKLINGKFYYSDKIPQAFVEGIKEKAVIRAINDLLEKANETKCNEKEK